MCTVPVVPDKQEMRLEAGYIYGIQFSLISAQLCVAGWLKPSSSGHLAGCFVQFHWPCCFCSLPAWQAGAVEKHSFGNLLLRHHAGNSLHGKPLHTLSWCLRMASA